MSVWEPLTDTVGVYRTESYPVHEDALRLAEFAHIRPSDRVLDLGTGNGILAVYALALHGGTYTGIDLDEDALSLAKQSAERNGQAITFLQSTVESASDRLGHGSFDRILMNPPYYTSGNVGRNALARHADGTLLEKWCRAAFQLLNNGGTLTLCYPAEQLAVLFRVLDRNRLSPKRIALLFSDETARLALVEAKKLGGDGVKITKA